VAGIEFGDAALVDVEADGLEAAGKRDGERQADIAEADDDDAGGEDFAAAIRAGDGRGLRGGEPGIHRGQAAGPLAWRWFRRVLSARAPDFRLMRQLPGRAESGRIGGDERA